MESHHLHHVTPRPPTAEVFSCLGHVRGFEPMRWKTFKNESKGLAPAVRKLVVPCIGLFFADNGKKQQSSW
jgi:hypothetical protein